MSWRLLRLRPCTHETLPDPPGALLLLQTVFPPGTGLGNGNYTFYQAVFYTLTVVLCASFVLCVFVGK